MSSYFTCPNCGADVPIKALSCPQCGSDDETGWSEEAKYIHLLPDHSSPSESPPQRLTSISSWNSWFLLALVVVLIGCTLSMPVIGALAATPLLLGGAIMWFIQRKKQSPPKKERPEYRGNSYTQLIQLTRGNQRYAEQLIDEERARTPIATRSEWIQAAIDRLMNDREK